MINILIILISSVLIFTASGCGLMYIGLENLSNTVFSSAEDAKIIIKDPVRQNVRLSAYRIGHSSTLIQIYGKVFLFDPVFNDVISGVMLRKQKAAIDIDSLSRLDMILISHSHPDHLSISTLSDLDKRFPHAKLIFPKGDEQYMPDYDFEFVRMRTGNSSKMNYTGETKIIDSVKITAVYTLHYGGRYWVDSFTWQEPGCTGYIIEYKGITVFYAGDTAYNDKAYKSLGKKFKIDLALIPIGPCRDCEELDNFRHVTSLGALQIFEDLKAAYMIPVHYGVLTYGRDPDYPLIVLKKLIEEKNNSDSAGVNKIIYKDRIKILEEGEQIIFDKTE